MSKRLDVLAAVMDLIATALPSAEVLGLDGKDAAADRVGPDGRVVVRSGDLGDPEIDLSPLAYHYEHRIPIEVAAYGTADLSSEAVVDAMLELIGIGVEMDRTLGGLVDWLEPTAAATDDVWVEGAEPPKGADLMLVASYATSNPLT